MVNAVKQQVTVITLKSREPKALLLPNLISTVTLSGKYHLIIL